MRPESRLNKAPLQSEQLNKVPALLPGRAVPRPDLAISSGAAAASSRKPAQTPLGTLVRPRELLATTPAPHAFPSSFPAPSLANSTHSKAPKDDRHKDEGSRKEGMIARGLTPRRTHCRDGGRPSGGLAPREGQPGPRRAGIHAASLRTNHTHLKHGRLRLKVKPVAKATLSSWQPRSVQPTALRTGRPIVPSLINSRPLAREEAPGAGLTPPSLSSEKRPARE